jgi:hypothetical protein
LHVLFDFFPQGGSVVINIEGRTADEVYPIFFVLLTEAAWTVSSVESLMARPGVPLIVANFDDIHLTIIR